MPEEDRYNSTDERAQNEIAILMGGRVAEELVFDGRKTNGAKNDIERATELARKMVCEWGMSELLGPLAFGRQEEQIFLGKEIAQHKDYSDETAKLIDAEVKRIVLENYNRAREILRDNLETLHRIAQALLDREVLSGEDVDRIVSGGEPARQPGKAGTGGWFSSGLSESEDSKESGGLFDPSRTPEPDTV